MILACLAFAVAALVEIKINVSLVTAKLLTCSTYFPSMFSLGSVGLTSVISWDRHGKYKRREQQGNEVHFPPE